MRNKRGQITAFIVVGIVILICVGLYLSLAPASEEFEVDEVIDATLEVSPIKNYVDSCIKTVGEDAVVYIGKHGGYFDLPEESAADYLENVPYYFYINMDLMPTKSRIQEELSKYVSSELFFCLRAFMDFREQGFDIEQGPVEVVSEFFVNKIFFKVNIPLTIRKGDSVTKLSTFSGVVDNKGLDKAYWVTRAFMDAQMEDRDSICLSCLIDLSIENNVHIQSDRIDDDVILFTITDRDTEIDGELYKYMFAAKYPSYSCNNPPPEPSQAFIMGCERGEEI